jgi:serine/threonine protein kinase
MAAARRACQGDDEALREVCRLLAHANVGSSFLRTPTGIMRRDATTEVGRVFGRRWRALRLLGAGSGGAVFEVEDVETGRRAALKLIRGMSEGRIRAVRQEVAFLRWLRLPGVVRLIDDGVDNDAAFCVTELIDGAPFPGAPVRADWACIEPVALALLEAVAGIHAAGVVHCDLKPANVLVDVRGRITILDLGISAEARVPFALKRNVYIGGTPGYAAPEQVRGGSPEVRWDLYAIGVLLFEALSGHRPSVAKEDECAALPAPLRARRVIASLLSPRRAGRPRSARDAIRRLRPSPRTMARRSRWTDSELRARFAGPDLLLHLREDAAAELMRRTDGDPRAVEREIASWIRAGLAHQDGDLVVVERPALERLRTLAATTSGRSVAPRDVSERVFARTLRRGTPREVAHAARRLAALCIAQGRPSSAMTVLFEGAAAARACEDVRLELSVLRDATAAAVRTAMSAELDRALLLLQRSSTSVAEVRDLETVVRAVLRLAVGRPADAMEAVAAICRSRRSDQALRLAWSVRNTIAHGLGIVEERRCVQGLRRWLRRCPERGARTILATAEGWLRYHESRYETAVGLHLRAARQSRDAHGRARCLLDAATAAVECRPADALEYALRARHIAEGLRNAVQEGRAIQIARAAIVRSGAAATPDREFVTATARLGFAGLAAGAALTEAVIAWRSGDAASCRELAMAAARTWGAAPLGDLARSLAAAAGEPIDDATLRRCRSAAVRVLPPAVGMQLLALVCSARPSWRARLRREFASLKLPTKDADTNRVRETMSIRDAESILSN